MKTDSVKMTTLNGICEAQGKVMLKKLRLPELDKNRIISEQEAFIFDSPCRYDVILGQDFLEKTGIDIRYSIRKVEWLGSTIPLRSPHDDTNEEEVMGEVFQSYLVQLEDEYFGEDWLDSYLTSPKTILDAKYEKLDVDTFAKEQSHLTCSQQDDLRDLLRKHERLFSGELGLYPHKKMHIELEPNAEPVHARAYSVPRMHEDTFKKELDHLVALGVLS